MLAALYARVSTLRQENEETIENQIMAIKDFVKEKELTIVKQYLDDGWSGTILVRPALDELRIDTKKKLTYKAKLEELIYKDTQGSISQFKVDELCEEAQKVIKTLDTTNKEAVIRDIITKVVIKGGTQVEVWGNIPLFDLNMGYESTSRNYRSSERWEKYLIQCAPKKESCIVCKLSICHG